MAKELNFDEYVSTYTDEDGDEHETVIQAHTVTDETKGDYNTVGGTERANKGDVLIKRDRPDLYDRISGKVFDGLEYQKRHHDVNGV
jgi:hypothetical protein